MQRTGGKLIMCFGSSSKYQREAAEAQAKAIQELAKAQNAKVTEITSKTNSAVKTNKDAQKRNLSMLRIPTAKAVSTGAGSFSSSYGLNIPL